MNNCYFCGVSENELSKTNEAFADIEVNGLIVEACPQCQYRHETDMIGAEENDRQNIY